MLKQATNILIGDIIKIHDCIALVTYEQKCYDGYVMLKVFEFFTGYTYCLWLEPFNLVDFYLE